MERSHNAGSPNAWRSATPNPGGISQAPSRRPSSTPAGSWPSQSPRLQTRANTRPKSTPRPGQHSMSGPQRRPVDEAWRSWVEVRIKASQIPTHATTADLYNSFSTHGCISRIRFETARYTDHGVVATITYSPPPHEAFWLHFNAVRMALPNDKYQTLELELLPSQPRMCPASSAASPQVPEKMMLYGNSISFGFMHSADKMAKKVTFAATHQRPLQLKLNLFARKHIEIKFAIHNGRHYDSYRIFIPLAQMATIQQTHHNDQTVLTFSLESPPKFYRMATDVEATHVSTHGEWMEQQAYFRQTDIDIDMSARNSLPVSLHRPGCRVDIGRWLTYSIIIPPSHHNQRYYQHFCQALRNHNIPVASNADLSFDRLPSDAVWEVLDSHLTESDYAQPKGLQLSSLDLLHDDAPVLNFEVRYQLEVCISQNNFSEYGISKDFLQRLSKMPIGVAQSLLENVAHSKQRYYEPSDIFHATGLRQVKKRMVPPDCVVVHSVTISPTTLYLNTPSAEISHRILRRYASHADRFLRARFADEAFYGQIQASRRDYGDTEDELFSHISRVLRNGIDVAGRHYEFLAFGNSQFRDKGAWFFAPTAELTTDKMRSEMGTFDHIDTVSKYTSRIGQCFSTTRQVRSVPFNFNRKAISDIFRNGYCFTDGVGKISPFFARMIGEEFKLIKSGEDYPSVFQFRMGGCKGVLALDPSLTGFTIHTRESQMKFSTLTENLEIIRTSSFASASLNQQIILVLSTLGIDDRIFLSKLRDMLSNVKLAMVDEQVALEMLQRNVDMNQTTLALATMILDGFMKVHDPFTMSLLHLWRAWNIKYLKEKAKIAVQKSAFLLGCVDETATLAMGPSELPEIFLQIPDPDNKGRYKMVVGICILARNPSLHPGDVRVVQAVACPALQHLKNVVVLPQKGDRPLANMCSGGDLDGDDYLVIWDEDFIPSLSERNHEPMDYTPPDPIRATGPVTVRDMTNFFVSYMKHDNLPFIAINHRVFADYLWDGVKSDKCIELAQLHSQAVDFAKTGVPATLTDHLRPEKWPHWMEKKNIPATRIYRSEKILGLLYDEVERVEFVPQYEQTFDKRILESYPDTCPEVISTVIELKRQYDDDIRRVMAQHGIRTEFEVWSAFVMDHNRDVKDYSFAEEMGRLMGMIKEHYRGLCYQMAGTAEGEGGAHRNFEKLAPFVAAMYKVTAEQVARATGEQRAGEERDGGMILHTTPLISFPWIFAAQLGRIANSDNGGQPHQVTSPCTEEQVMAPVNAVELGQETSGSLTPKEATEKHSNPVLAMNAIVDLGGENSASDISRAGSSSPSSSSFSIPSSFNFYADHSPIDPLGDDLEAIGSPVGAAPEMHSIQDTLIVLEDNDMVGTTVVEQQDGGHGINQPQEPPDKISGSSSTSSFAPSLVPSPLLHGSSPLVSSLLLHEAEARPLSLPDSASSLLSAMSWDTITFEPTACEADPGGSAFPATTSPGEFSSPVHSSVPPTRDWVPADRGDADKMGPGEQRSSRADGGDEEIQDENCRNHEYKERREKGPHNESTTQAFNCADAMTSGGKREKSAFEKLLDLTG